MGEIAFACIHINNIYYATVKCYDSLITYQNYK